MPYPTIIEHYRRTFEIDCPLLSAMPRKQLVTIDPFLERGGGYIILADPSYLLKQWQHCEFGNAPSDLGSLTKGLTGYRTARALRQSIEAPVSMPMVELSCPSNSVGRIRIVIHPRSASLLAGTALAGCRELPICVTGPDFTGQVRRDWPLIERFTKTAEYHHVSDWQVGVPYTGNPPTQSLEPLTSRAWISDTAAFADRKGFAKVREKLDHLFCAGILYTEMRHCDADRMASELSIYRVEALKRMRNIRDSGIELIDRFDAGHKRLIARHLGEFETAPETALNRMVTELGKAIIFDKKTAPMAERYLTVPARAALDWLASNPKAQTLPRTEPLAVIAFARFHQQTPRELRL